MSENGEEVQPQDLAEDKQEPSVQQEPSLQQEPGKDEITTENLDEDISTASKKVRMLRTRKKSAKTRLTKARKQLADLVVKKASKTEIKKAIFKVESEYEIILKLIYNLKEITVLEDSDENVDIDVTIEALDKEVDEIHTVVESAVKAAKEHVQQRLEMGEAKSTVSSRSNDDDRSSVLTISSSLASKRRKEVEESKQRLLALEQEQQQEEEELQNRVAALQLTKQRTEEARQVVVINEARATAAENEAMIHENTGQRNTGPGDNLESKNNLNRKEFSHELSDMPVKQYPTEVEHSQRQLAPIRLKGVELPTFSGENKADYAPWKAAFMSVVDEAAISVNEKMLRLQHSLTGKALRMVKDLGYTMNAYERAKEKLEKKYGGELRLQISNLTTLRGWPKLRSQNLEDMEEFLALLDRILVSVQDSRLGAVANGHSLNLTAKEKLTASDLQAYKYWLYEHSEIDTFEALVRWLEIRVQIMDETKDERRDDRNDDKRRNRGFNGAITKRRPRGCVVTACKEDHPPWVCQAFKRMSVSERRELISKSGRCFRCLALGHQSKGCHSAKKCGVNGCTSDRHSRYLHENDQRRPDKPPFPPRDDSDNHDVAAPPNNQPQERVRETAYIKK